MITYVNTVLVGTGVGTLAGSIEGATAGQYVIVDLNGNVLTAATAAAAEAIKVGLATNKTTTIKSYDATAKKLVSKKVQVIKWSNIIKKADLKSYHFESYKDDTEDTITIDFTKATDAAKAELAEGNKRVIVKLTFKDLPTRYRKWTESYEYVTAAGDTATEIAAAFEEIINEKNAKRARVEVSAASGVLTIVALPYDDDDTVDSISWANKVRLSANVWYTDPMAAGFASKNKYAIQGVEIVKTPGTYYTGSAKLVRDAEANAMGYQGILNRGEGTWPVIKPEMNSKLDGQYDSLTLEFENMYRTADDLQRKTKQTLQIFEETGKMAAQAVIEGFVKGANYNNGASATVATGTSDAE